MDRAALVGVLVVVTSLGLASESAEARPSASKCRSVCAPQIRDCVEAGNRRRACRKSFVRRCRRDGTSTCLGVPNTTSSTRVTPTSFPTTTTVPGTSSTTDLPTSSTSTTTSSTSTTTLAVWFENGPIQWATPPPPAVAAGEQFPLALDVDVDTVRVEGHVRSCVSGAAPTSCGSTDGAFAFESTFFAGPPGRFEFDVIVNPLPQCKGSYGRQMLAELFLWDGDDVKHGPFYSPLAFTDVVSDRGSALSASPLVLAARAGTSIGPQGLYFGISCPAGQATVWASWEAPWLSLVGAFGSFQVTADTTGLDPAGSPYTAEVTLTTEGADPLIVPVTLYVVTLDVGWTTPPPAVVEPESTFPLALSVTGEGVDGVKLSLQARYDGPPTFPAPPVAVTSSRLLQPLGTVTATGRRGTACLREARGAEIVGWLAVQIHDGPLVDGIPIPPAPFEVAPMTAIRTEVRSSPTDRRTIQGGVVPQAHFGVFQNCGTPQDWTAESSVPWLTLPYDEGKALVGTTFVGTPIQFDTSALTGAASPYQGSVVVNAPGLPGGSTSIDATVEIEPSLTATWSVQPPAVVADGDQLTATLALGGSASTVLGRVEACAPYDLLCGSLSVSIPFANRGLFVGPPGEFTFTGARQPWCFGDGPNQLRATLWALRQDDTVVGPFEVRSNVFQAPKSGALMYRVEPEALTLRGVEGQSPLVTGFDLRGTYCQAGEWTVEVDVPWVVLPNSAGSFFNLQPIRVPVGIDTQQLEPGTHAATITVHATGALPAQWEIPLVVDLFPASSG